MPIQLKIFPEKCIGCRSCELACSLANEGEFNPAKSRISQMTFLEGKYPLPYNFVSTCRQCSDASCLSSCPVTAISRSRDKTKVVVIDSNACIGCGKCVDACPFGAMLFSKEQKKAFKCELCGGDPACALICPSQAIIYGKRKSFYSKNEDGLRRGWTLLSERNRSHVRKLKSRKEE